MTTADQRAAPVATRTGDGATRLILGMVVSNGGDAAILHAQLAVLERALGSGTTWLEDSDPALAKELFPALSVIEHDPLAEKARALSAKLGYVRRAPFRQVAAPLALRALPALTRRRAAVPVDKITAQVPLVFHTGGTTLIEKYDLTTKLRHLVHAVRSGKTVVLLPQSLGPFRANENVAAVREIVEGAALVLLRDDRSRQHLADIGARLDRVHVVPDVVFTMTGDSDIDKLATARVPATHPRVAIGTRDCRNFFESGDPDDRQNALESEYAALVTHLVRERGADVTFVSTCQGVDRYWTDDSRVAVSVFERLPDDVRSSCRVDRAFHDTEGLRSILGGHDLVVATRLHGAILALSVGVPVVAIEYEFKTRQVFRQLDQETAVYPIDEAGSRSLAEHADTFIERWPSDAGRAAEALRGVVAGAWSAANLLAEAVRPVER